MRDGTLREVFGMRLGDDGVRAGASEAGLCLTDEERESVVRGIDDFLDMADRLKELDLENVEPFRFPESMECPLREDEPKPFGAISEILAARMTDADGGAYFKVPRIMEE